MAITPSGVEEVFDIQVEGTENFIANGIVSHNTRWGTSDLIGRLSKDMVMNPDADQYEVVEFPALFEKDEVVEGEELEDPDDPTSPLHSVTKRHDI